MSIFKQLLQPEYYGHAFIIVAFITGTTYLFQTYSLEPLVMFLVLFIQLVIADVIAHWTMNKFFGWKD